MELVVCAWIVVCVRFVTKNRARGREMIIISAFFFKIGRECGTRLLFIIFEMFLVYRDFFFIYYLLGQC